MRRGAISKAKQERKAFIARVIESQRIPRILADRIAFQLVFKFDLAELGDQAVWRAIGRLLQQEIGRLKVNVGLADRQIVEVIPKLSAPQIEDFLDELRTTDTSIARTILNAALEAAEPLSAGRRYLAEYRGVAEQLQAIEPNVARTLANASFTASTPRKKAMEHFKRFADLMMRFKNPNRSLARLPAKAAFRDLDPTNAAEKFLGDYNAALTELAANGVEGHVAKTIASSGRFRRHLLETDTIATGAERSGQRALTSLEREELNRLREENRKLRTERNAKNVNPVGDADESPKRSSARPLTRHTQPPPKAR